jgi:mRNA interferase MazF
MTTYSFSDVLLVPFPFTDQTTIKKRPAIVVSSDDYHHQRSDLILMAVTSQVNPVIFLGEVRITEWQATGLLKPSTIKPVLTTLAKDLVIRKLGQLREPDLQSLLSTLETILGS